MPSSAQTKTSGSKSRTKPSATKNVSEAASTKDIRDSAPLPDVNKPLEATKSYRLSDKASPRIASPGPAPSTNKIIQESLDYTTGNSGVNKKKQKRRQKEAARKAAEQHAMTGSQLAQEFVNVADSAYQDIVKEIGAAQARAETNGYEYGGSDYDDPEQYEPDDGEDISWEYTSKYDPPRTNGHTPHNYTSAEPPSGKAKKKKKKTSKSSSAPQADYSTANHTHPSNPTSFQPPPPPPPPPLGQPLPSGSHQSPQTATKDRIWNTSTAEERERIKEFWLSLGEEDRRSLVKVEKEAVLKKMKEQQKHSCSCTVCGRKRTAIEEELEVLYDAYYEELEQYANNQQIIGEDGTIMAPSQFHHPLPRASTSRRSQMLNGRSSRGRMQEIGEDDEAADEDDYSEEEEDDEISEYDDGEEQAGSATDFFNFGDNLTVQDGILTVADDLLKNDGKKFIEMMEQLAERRMQREEEAQYAAAGMGHPSMQGHNHGPPLDDDGYDDDEDDEYDSQEYDEDDEEDDMGSMSEKDRMKEGRRMFQIFAARMFEQRVLTAYREKVALERQQKLLEELDDESRVDAQREAKKAKEAQKKKDKKRQQKQAKDEEKARRDAEKAAEEHAAKVLEERKAEELRQKKEEQRKKKEAEKKAQEEEKHRKEAEKQRRLREAKEQQVEHERKQREQKEHEKKKREEVRRKEREERELRENEAREKKERGVRAKSEAEAKTQIKKDEAEAKQSVQTAQSVSKRPSPANGPSIVGSVPPGLHPPLTTSSHASPHLQIATPVVPKAPTPMRQRQQSLQESRNNSPKTPLPAASSSTTSPAASATGPNGTLTGPGKGALQPILTQQSQPSSSYYGSLGASSGQISQPPGLSSMPSMVASAFPSSAFGPPPSPMTQQAPHHPVMYSNQATVGGSQYRNFMGPNGISFPPGINGPRQMPQGRGGMMDPPPSQISPIGVPTVGSNDVSRYGLSRDNIPSHIHSRNTSASFDRSGFETPSTPAQAQPIARPAPIKRPSSAAPHQQGGSAPSTNTDVDDLSNHLGSSVLLEDTDDPLTSNSNDSRRGSMAPGAARSVRQGFGINSGFSDAIGTTRIDNLPRGMQNGNGNTWSAQQSPFGGPQMSGPPHWSNGPGFGRPNNSNAFGSIGSASRANPSRAATIRMAVRTACEKMDSRVSNGQASGWLRVEDLLREVQLMKAAHEVPINSAEMLEFCDIPGNTYNGDGSFTRLQDSSGWVIRYEPGRSSSIGGIERAVDIGSPSVGGTMPVIGGQRLFQQPGAY